MRRSTSRTGTVTDRMEVLLHNAIRMAHFIHSF